MTKRFADQTKRGEERFSCRTNRKWAGIIISATMAMLLVMPLLAGGPAAQNQKKSKDKNQADAEDAIPVAPMTDSQAIDLAVSQMLGAWQVGDVDAMHKYCADDMVVVSGNWEPPLVGWDAYVRAYQVQRARSQNGRMDRSNTLTKVMGDSAWVTYQWEYVGQVDGSSLDAVGHTTLVLQKHAGNWVIVLNHTSTSPLPVRSSAAQADAPSAKP